jgi:hypothetical protein
MNIWQRLTGRTRATERDQLAVRAVDDRRDTPLGGAAGDRDRRPYDRRDVLDDCLEAWRTNPLARRLVSLTSQYVVGDGVSLECDHAPTHAFVHAFWNHPLNRMPVRAYEWCDELTRTGELFVLLSTDAAGMSYVRAFPARQVRDIECDPGDAEQPVAFLLDADDPGLATVTWPAYRETVDLPDDEGRWSPAMLHFAVNRPVGARRGEPDLAPLLRWLVRYSAWLEDRARLNRFRQSFVYWVRKAFMNDAERAARQAQLNANPPSPGSILVTDEAETWAVLHPKLDSFEAAEDGLAMKKLICAGAGVPLHFLAEPESATRTTAEQAGGPTFRHYTQRQTQFLWALLTVVRAAVRRRALTDHRVSLGARITITGADISARDNATLAQAAQNAAAAFGPLAEKGVISNEELARLVYRFAGEAQPVEGT